MHRPEDAARETIDAALVAAGWVVQDYAAMNLAAARGVAVREFPLRRGFGFADYMLYVDGEAVGVLEAKREGSTLTGVEVQAEKYAAGMPDHLPAPVRPLPFLYQSTGVETRFTDRLDQEPRSRAIFHMHRPVKRADLDEFVACYKPGARHDRQPTWFEANAGGRWRAYDFAELVARDKCSLDLFWLRDESLEASNNLPAPGLIATEIVEDLRAALEQFEAVAADLSGG